jgi:hypothetical protein
MLFAGAGISLLGVLVGYALSGLAEDYPEED